MKKSLKTAPTVDRFEAAADPKGKTRVDREGGRYGAGVIFAVSLCSRGEALGHCMWIDDVMLQQIVDLSPAGPKFLKSRFTHPDWCSDGMGKGLGTIENLKLVEDQVYGDLHFYSAAHDAPDGDLAGYVMNLAEEDPVNFGLSIVFTHDWQAEDEFRAENTKTVELQDDDGNVVETRKQYQSPDPLNIENYPHARIAEMRAADVVDEPAANPKGLFHRENELLADGGKLIEFVLGRSSEVPALSTSLGVDVAPERLKSFVSKYLAKAGISLATKEQEMAKANVKSKLAEEKPVDEEKDEKEKPADEKPADDKPKETEADEEPDEEVPADDEKPEDDSASKQSKGKSKPDATLQEYCAAFGNADGAQYFMDGVSFKDAQTKSITSLKSQLKERDDKLAAFAKLGVDPVGFNAAADKDRDAKNRSALGEADGEIDARTAFANAIADKK